MLFRSHVSISKSITIASSIVKSSMIAVFLLSSFGLVSCSGGFPPGVYRMDIRQGNDITPEMVSKLRRGLSKDQIQELLGTPTLSHSLDTDRWDYYYCYVPGKGNKRVEKHFTVFFKNGKVTSWTDEKS